MYLKHFDLKEAPFNITPDPRYLFMSVSHQEALAHLLYGITHGSGFVQLTGQVGTGKTTLSRCLLQQLPNNVDVALVLNPKVSALELLSTLCDELQIRYDKQHSGIKALIDALNSYLLATHAQGRRTVLIVDEAQNLSLDVLEQIRLLTNLETSKDKLLQIVLIGQPELQELLSRPETRPVAQRITARYHLESLSAIDCQAYIQYRLAVAGAKSPLFNPQAVRTIYRASKGIPRLINILCDRCLLGAFAQNLTMVDQDIARHAVREILYQTGPGLSKRWQTGLSIAAAVLGLTSALWLLKPMLGLGQDPQQTAAKIIKENRQKIEPVDPTKNNNETIAAAGETITVGDLDRWLRSHELVSEENAVKSLAQLWSMDVSTETASGDCSALAQVGLRCLKQSGTWNSVRQLNLPAVLELTDRLGTPHYVVVAGMDDQSAQLQIDGQRRRIARQVLDRYWFGHFLVLWHPPRPDTITLEPGMFNRDVAWLRESLTRIRNLSIEGAIDNHYDAKLQEQVTRYQQSQQLTADGIVGPLTFIALQNDLADPSSPRLFSNPVLAREQVQD